MKDRMRLALAIFAHKEDKTFVLGAYGCGGVSERSGEGGWLVAGSIGRRRLRIVILGDQVHGIGHFEGRKMHTRIRESVYLNGSSGYATE